jgi:hypothetical protein
VFAKSQEQLLAKWQGFAAYALKNGLIEKPLEASELFQNLLSK